MIDFKDQVEVVRPVTSHRRHNSTLLSLKAAGNAAHSKAAANSGAIDETGSIPVLLGDGSIKRSQVCQNANHKKDLRI